MGMCLLFLQRVMRSIPDSYVLTLVNFFCYRIMTSIYRCYFFPTDFAPRIISFTDRWTATIARHYCRQIC
jgi:hypothetical protein